MLINWKEQMKVHELIKQLEEMPHNMSVHLINGHGIRSAFHQIRGNLVGFDQICYLVTYFEDDPKQYPDGLIERETGFADRVELIAAYKKLLEQSKPKES